MFRVQGSGIRVPLHRLASDRAGEVGVDNYQHGRHVQGFLAHKRPPAPRTLQ